MTNWPLIEPLLQSPLDAWAALLSRIPAELAFAAIILPVAFAVFSRRIVALLGCTLLAAVAIGCFVSPFNLGSTLAVGAYLGSLILALSAILARRKADTLQTEIAALREDVNELLGAERNRIIKDLKELGDLRADPETS